MGTYIVAKTYIIAKSHNKTCGVTLMIKSVISQVARSYEINDKLT